jgi:hypothetical protein
MGVTPYPATMHRYQWPAALTCEISGYSLLSLLDWLSYGLYMRTEDERVGRLLDAQANAVALFDEVVARGIIAAGQGEQAVSDQIRDLRAALSYILSQS